MKHDSWKVVATALLGFSQPVPANQAHDMLLSMPESKRNEALSAFMAKSGESCNVTRSFFQGKDKQDFAFWNVGCASGKSFAIMIYANPTGSTKILDCKTLKAVAKTDCFKKF
jgi:hypothetical protein